MCLERVWTCSSQRLDCSIHFASIWLLFIFWLFGDIVAHLINVATLHKRVEGGGRAGGGRVDWVHLSDGILRVRRVGVSFYLSFFIQNSRSTPNFRRTTLSPAFFFPQPMRNRWRHRRNTPTAAFSSDVRRRFSYWFCTSEKWTLLKWLLVKLPALTNAVFVI